jgi:hypothetical protein
MALIAPELIVTWAMRQWISARHVTRQFKKTGYPSIRPEQPEYNQSAEAPERRENRVFRLLFIVLAKAVSSALAFLCRFPGALANSVKRSVKAHFSERPEDYTWTQTHSFFVLMGGFMLYVDEKPYHTLQPGQLIELIREGCIDIPTLTAK